MKYLKNFVFKDNNFELEMDVLFMENNVYLSIDDIANLFEKSRSTISKHIKNIYKEGFYKEETTCSKFAHMVSDLGREYETAYYNLDIVISVGYKVKSNRGHLFKQMVIDDVEKNNSEIDTNNIIIYDNGSAKVSLNVSFEEQTVWATQKEIADVFSTSVSNINYHIKRILVDRELDANSVIKSHLNTGPDGKNYKATFYNLDMVLAVGFRVSTKKATNFRRWASGVLSEYMIKGYSVHEERCLECQNAIIGLQSRVLELEKNQNKTFSIYPGDELKSFAAIERLLRSAKNEILIVDNYFGHGFDSVLSEIKVQKVVITNPKNTKIETNEIYKVIKTNDFHDRYIIVDDICFFFGQSPGELGTKISSSVRIRDKILIDTIKSFRNK